jgi:hypothetical protein
VTPGRPGGDAATQSLGEHGARVLARVGQQHDELLAAVAVAATGVADEHGQDGPEGAEHGVAGPVAVAVVDRLEVVEVGDDQGGRAVVEDLAEVAPQGAAVQQPRQVVGVCEAVEPVGVTSGAGRHGGLGDGHRPGDGRRSGRTEEEGRRNPDDQRGRGNRPAGWQGAERLGGRLGRGGTLTARGTAFDEEPRAPRLLLRGARLIPADCVVRLLHARTPASVAGT